MKSKKFFKIIWLFLSPALIMGFFGGAVLWADDTDVWRASAKNNAMMVLDSSGSMSWPVYDETHDYAAFMRWMRDPDGVPATSDALAYDDGSDGSGSYPFEAANTWWDKDASHPPDQYDRLDPNRIYLVCAFVDHKVITFTDSNGNTQSVSAIADVMWNTGSESSYSNNKRHPLLSEATFLELKDGSGNYWTLNDDKGKVNIETTMVGEEEHVVFPTTITFVDGYAGAALWDTITNNFAGQTLPNYQDILLTNKVTDDMTNVVTDTGFVGFLKASGFYFSGLFENETSHIQFVDSHASAQHGTWGYRVYLFATGNFLNFIKLVEDFKVTTGYETCANNLDRTYSTQRYTAWRSVCDKSAGTTGPSWITSSITIQSHEPEYGCDLDCHPECQHDDADYPDGGTGDFLRGEINPPGNDTARIKVRFAYIDTDPCGSGTDNDYVELKDAEGNSLLCIKGNQVGPADCTDYKNWNAAVSYDGGVTWQNRNPLDSQGFTEELNAGFIRVYWHNGSVEGCSYYDRGFKITGYAYTSEAAGEAGDYTCCNGSDGYGFKIKSRMDVAKSAMEIVIDETRDKLNWGLTRYNGGDGGTVLADLAGDPDTIITEIKGINPGGSTPLGESIQDAYNSDYVYIDSHQATMACAKNYIIAMTDGFPTSDGSWSRISDSTAENFPNPTFGYCAAGYGQCSDTYGDADSWLDSNHTDDAAYWLYHEATYKHTVHSIAFGLNNPMLGDVADSSAGLYITAYNQEQLVNAFYKLGLAMESTVSFVAPVVSVNETNRTQSGDSMYMAFFRPESGEYWKGNLKKYGVAPKIRTECGRTEYEWTIVDRDGGDAVDCNDGAFKPGSISYWSHTADGGKVDKGGAGGLLKDAIEAVSLGGGTEYDFRRIYTYIEGATPGPLQEIKPDNTYITNALLDVTEDIDRYKIINFLYGYTYGAVSGSDATPKDTREWILGDIIHSEPTVIEYFYSDYSLKYRLIALGANDGMLHVFLDYAAEAYQWGGKVFSPGEEVFAFVPPDLLSRLKEFETADPTEHPYFVDGPPNLFRARTKNNDGYFHKTFVFGERRGGRNYWALDVTNPLPSDWSLKWHIPGGTGGLTTSVTHPIPELGQTWNRPFFATIQTGSGAYTDVVIFAGGYDPLEDDFPEPFEDDDQNPNGIRDGSPLEPYTDANANSQYDYYNPEKDAMGRGIYVRALSDGSHVFSAAYCGDACNDDGSNDVTVGADQTFAMMRYCFPADMSVVSLSKSELLIYAADIYGQIWKITYNYYADPASTRWKVKRIFAANGWDMPINGTNRGGSDQSASGPDDLKTDFLNGVSLVNTDMGRKTFYSPDLSLGGNEWTGRNVLYFGTGDRAHPRYAMIKNRFYVVADYGYSSDSDQETDERHLFNLTCDELDDHVDANSDGLVNADDGDYRNDIKDIIKNRHPGQLPDHECRGWFRALEGQANCASPISSHVGEKVLSRPFLFHKNVFSTTYQPVFGDPCNPGGTGRIYAIDYSWGTHVFNFYLDNDIIDEEHYDVRDTYMEILDTPIPSGVRPYFRGDKVGGFPTFGGRIPPMGPEGTTIPGPPGGVSRMIWEAR